MNGGVRRNRIAPLGYTQTRHPIARPSPLFHKVQLHVLAHVSARVLDMSGTHRAPGQRVAYLRVSSAGQNLARQLEAVGECDQTFTENQSGLPHG